MALNISGRMKVKTLRNDFKEEFGLTMRVYDGRSFADDDATLASIRKGDSKGGEFAPKRNTQVGNLEDKILDMFGIKTQIAGSDDSYLCNNDLTLKAALEEDEKKLGRKEKKTDKKTKDDSQEINPELKAAFDQIQDAYTDLEATGEDWVEDTLKEVEDDVIREAELEEYLDSGNNTTLQDIFFSSLINDSKRKDILTIWVQCFEDLTEVEIVLS